jgi:Protein of unknown function (DUF2844)
MANQAIVLQNVSMVGRSITHSLLFMILGIGLLWVGEARGSLGGDMTSVLEDAGELHGVAQASLLQQVEIQEIESDNGMRIREFLNRAGIVFAVTWAGPVAPDLQQLLGPQFAAYTAALAGRPRLGLQRFVRVATPDLVVESEGHLRACTGRAYLPAMIPTGVSAAELR